MINSTEWCPESLEEEVYGLECRKTFDSWVQNRPQLQQDVTSNDRYGCNNFKVASVIKHNENSGSSKTLKEILNPDLKQHQIPNILRNSGINSIYENRISAQQSIPQPIKTKELDKFSSRPIVLSSDIFKEDLTSSDNTSFELDEKLMKLNLQNDKLPLDQRYKTLFDSSDGSKDFTSTSSESCQWHVYDPSDYISDTESEKSNKYSVLYKRIMEEGNSEPKSLDDDDNSSVWSAKSSLHSENSQSTSLSSTSASTSSGKSYSSTSSGKSSRKGSKKNQYKKLDIDFTITDSNQCVPPEECGLSQRQLFLQKSRFN